MDRINVGRFSFRRKHSKKDKEKSGLQAEQLTYLSQDATESLYADLRDEYAFSADQLLELNGMSCAMAITKVYPPECLLKQKGAILICCGPDNNGAEGLVCSRHLKTLGYKPTIFYPKRPGTPVFMNLVTQCEKMDIPFLSYLPHDSGLITDAYNLIIDAVYGHRFRSPPTHEFDTIIKQLQETKTPIISLDIPSGWDVNNGNPDGLQPEMLISVMAPKMCAKHFTGQHHYLANRMIPVDLAKKFGLMLPNFPLSECCVLIQTKNDTLLKPEDEPPKLAL